MQIRQKDAGGQVRVEEERLGHDPRTAVTPGLRAEEISSHLLDEDVCLGFVEFVEHHQPALPGRQRFQKVEIPLEQSFPGQFLLEKRAGLCRIHR